jgi:hypothetical protein
MDKLEKKYQVVSMHVNEYRPDEVFQGNRLGRYATEAEARAAASKITRKLTPPDYAAVIVDGVPI